MKKAVSIFYGGGVVNEKDKPTQMPLGGDPLDDIKSTAKAKALEIGYSPEEIESSFASKPVILTITITKDDIRIGDYVVERLDPSVRAFYILVARHPEGLNRKHGQKITFDSYEEEYVNIYNSISVRRKILRQGLTN